MMGCEHDCRSKLREDLRTIFLLGAGRFVACSQAQTDLVTLANYEHLFTLGA
jgi:hypothetical protein